MKRVLALTCFLSMPALAQMQMPMPGMTEHPAPAKKVEKNTAPAPRQEARPGQDKTPQQPAAMPFGKLADGDTSLAPRAVPDAPVPVPLSGAVQEQEHPARRTGTGDTPVPDLLADVKARTPEPLRFFTDRAMANNPTLRQANAQVLRLRAEAKQAGLWQNPELGYEADHVRGGSYAGGEQGGYIQQTIPLVGQRTSARGVLRAQVTTAETILTAQQQRVISSVEQAFYEALVAQRETELRQQMTALATDAAVATHQFANIGQADAPDVLGSEVEREQAKLELATAQRAFRKAFTRLAAVSGDATLPIAPLIGDLSAAPVLREDLATEAADGSAAVKAARQEASARDAAVRSARKQAGPQLILKAGLQQDNEPLDPALRRVGVVGIAQAGLTLPLWNRNQGGVEAARAQQLGAEAEIARTQLSLRMQAAQAMQDYQNAMGQAREYRDELLPRAERSVELYDQKYAAMAAAYPQRLAARKMLLQLQLEYARALGSAWENAVLLQHGLLQGGLSAPEIIAVESSGDGTH